MGFSYVLRINCTYNSKIFNEKSDIIIVEVVDIKKLLYAISGFFSLFLGIIGIALPVIPTTPLLLLALFCFTKSSKKIETWFIGTILYRKYLRKYIDRKGLTKKQKIFIQVMASLMIALSFIFLKYWLFRILLLILFLIHNYIFIFRIKTLPEDNH